MLNENLKTYPKYNMLIVKPVAFCTSDEKLQGKKVQINIIVSAVCVNLGIKQQNV
jgi:hypothetical protein